MKKTLFLLLVLTFFLGFTSCSKTKKLEDATKMLAASFNSNLGKIVLEEMCLSPEDLSFDGKDVVVKISVDKSIPSVSNFSFDKWVNKIIVETILGDNINASLLGRVLKTEDHGNPVRDYLNLMEKLDAKFIIEVQAWDGKQTLTMTPGEAKDILKMPQEKTFICDAASMFLYKYKDLKDRGLVKDIKIDNNTCCINTALADKEFVGKLNTLPPFLGYVVLNDLELKINNTIVPKEQVNADLEEAKQRVLRVPVEESYR